MSFGLEVFGASGALQFDTNSTMGRIISYGTVSWAAGASGSIAVTVAAMLSTDRVMASGTNFVAGGGVVMYSPFTVSVSGTSITFFRAATFNTQALAVFYTVVRMQ